MSIEGFPVRHTLRDGKEVSIRLAGPEDKAALTAFFRGLPEQDRLYLRDDVTSEEFVARYLSRLSRVNTVALVAETDGAIIGEATLYRDTHGWMTHLGQIRLVVSRPFQHLGLGTELARETVRIAMNQGLDKIMALVVDNQVGARKAFAKLGFKEEALLKKHVQDIHGRKRDLVVMTNDVSHLWESLASASSDHPPHMDSTE
jgi:RimJ/RimL family protein N-acetyltransferase